MAAVRRQPRPAAPPPSLGPVASSFDAIAPLLAHATAVAVTLPPRPRVRDKLNAGPPTRLELSYTSPRQKRPCANCGARPFGMRLLVTTGSGKTGSQGALCMRCALPWLTCHIVDLLRMRAVLSGHPLEVVRADTPRPNTARPKKADAEP